MKPLLLGWLLPILLVCGCNRQSSPPAAGTITASNASNPLDAPGDYLKAVTRGQQSAVKTIDTTSLKKAIDLFNVDQGRNPTDVDELVRKKYIPQLPVPPAGTRLVYDAIAGTVKVEQQ